MHLLDQLVYFRACSSSSWLIGLLHWVQYHLKQRRLVDINVDLKLLLLILLNNQFFYRASGYYSGCKALLLFWTWLIDPNPRHCRVLRLEWWYDLILHGIVEPSICYPTRHSFSSFLSFAMPHPSCQRRWYWFWYRHLTLVDSSSLVAMWFVLVLLMILLLVAILLLPSNTVFLPTIQPSF